MKTNRRNLFKLLAALPLALTASATQKPEPKPTPLKSPMGEMFMMLNSPYTPGSRSLGEWLANHEKRHGRPYFLVVANAGPTDLYILRKSGHDVLVITDSPLREWYYDAAQLVFKVDWVTEEGWYCSKVKERSELYCTEWFWSKDDDDLSACVKPIKL